MSLHFVLLKMGTCVKAGDSEGLNTSAHLPLCKGDQPFQKYHAADEDQWLIYYL